MSFPYSVDQFGDPARARLVVAVAPVLLGDVLCRALRFEGHDVVLYVTDELHPEPRLYDIAVISEELPIDVSANTVIRLPDLPDGDLPSVLGAIRDTLVRYPGPAGMESV